jgi:spore maturation protein CgeB
MITSFKKKRIYLTLAIQASSGYNDFTWKYIFFDTLVKMGHDVVLYTYDEARIIDGERSNNINYISNNILNHFELNYKFKPFDIFFSYYHSLQVVPELFKRVREKSICINYTTNFHQIDTYTPLLQEANLSIYASSDAESYFKSHNINSYYLPFAGLKKNIIFNPNKNNNISFLGTSYGHRPYYLWRCLQQKLPIQIYGANWVNTNLYSSNLRLLKLQKEILFNEPSALDTIYRSMTDLIIYDINKKYKNYINNPVSDEDYNILLSKSSIILNIPESRFGHDFTNPNVLIGANLRDFEAPTSGAFLLTQENDEIKSFFEVGKEIETFCNEWELIDKCKFYLKNPKIILKIAKAGQKRVINEHLWQHRFDLLFLHLNKLYF